MSWGSRNFPLSGQNWKNPDGTYPHDWSTAWLVGSAALIALFILVCLAYGTLR